MGLHKHEALQGADVSACTRTHAPWLESCAAVCPSPWLLACQMQPVWKLRDGARWLCLALCGEGSCGFALQMHETGPQLWRVVKQEPIMPV